MLGLLGSMLHNFSNSSYGLKQQLWIEINASEFSFDKKICILMMHLMYNLARVFLTLLRRLLCKLIFTDKQTKMMKMSPMKSSDCSLEGTIITVNHVGAWQQTWAANPKTELWALAWWALLWSYSLQHVLKNGSSTKVKGTWALLLGNVGTVGNVH